MRVVGRIEKDVRLVQLDVRDQTGVGGIFVEKREG